MDLRRLKDKLEKEMEIGNEIAGAVAQALVAGGRSSISVLDFYPEFRNKLKDKTYTNWLPNVFWTQMPFFHKLVLKIERCETEDEYKRQLGISVQETIDLMEKGKVIAYLAGSPTNYADLDYLDPILERNLPSGVIFHSFEMILPNLRALKTGGHDFLEVKKMWKEECRKSLGRKLVRRRISTSLWDPLAEERCCEYYADLCLHGYENLARSLLDLGPTFSLGILAVMSVYRDLLVDRLRYESFEGIPSFGLQEFVLFKHVTKGLKAPLVSNRVIRSFPYDIGKLLIENFNLIRISDIGIKKIIEVSEETEKARRALLELDKAVQEREYEKLTDRAIALQQVWEETNQELERMIGKKKILTRYVLPVFIGAVGGAIGGAIGVYWEVELEVP